MKPPEIRYAASGEVRIAYQVVGQGSLDLVLVPGFVSNLEIQWEDARFAELLRRLTTFARVVLFDKRGTGLSDRIDPQNPPALETRMDDVRAVMDASGSGRAALLGASDGAAVSIMFAATYPDRARALVLYGGYGHFRTWALGQETLAKFMHDLDRAWGTGSTLRYLAPSRSDDARFQSWWARFERLSATPTAALALARMNAQIDVRKMLPFIRGPALVLHRADDAYAKAAGGRYLAERIKDARFIELPGRDHVIWTADFDRLCDEVEEFLTGMKPQPYHARVLATILIARLVGPERIASRLGDGHWSERVDRFHDMAAAIMVRFGGQQIGFGAEQLSARFDAPARAIRCALAWQDAADGLELRLAAAVHTGEIELNQQSAAGLALHVAERIAVRAKVGEIVASRVVGDLVAGSGIHFVEHGSAPIEGLDAPLSLLAVAREQHLEPTAVIPGMPDLQSLSARERQVLSLVADGLSNAAIAERLRLSEHTVKRHVANILLKLDLPTRAAAAALIGRQSSA